MAVVVGTQGALTSWAGPFNSALVANIIPTGVSWSITTPTTDDTGLNATAAVVGRNLRAWSGSITGHARSAPATGLALKGNNLAVAMTGLYTTHVRSMQFAVSPIGVYEHTSTTSLTAAPGWSDHRPDRAIGGTWSVTAGLDDTTALSGIPAIGDTIQTLTLTYNTNATVAGSGIVDNVSPAVSVGSMSVVTISGRFTGAITPAGVNSIFGTNAFAEPLWTGSTTPTLVWQQAPSRTYTGAAFYTSIGLNAQVDQNVGVTIGFQGMRALTIG
jgi:hypothetical protein